MSAAPARRITPVEALALAAALAGGLWLGTRAGDGDDGAAAAARFGTRTGGPGAGVAALTVRTTDGRTLPLSGIGAPAVAMVVSTTCGVCKEALRDFGRAGRALPGLWLVTLEGAERGRAMLDSAGVTGAVLAGPQTPAAEALFAFQIQGTPTFVALDARGRVEGVLPGYPGREAIAPWLAVMSGDAPALRTVDAP
jgi:hypothetical protein